jgi:hypothetical protein
MSNADKKKFLNIGANLAILTSAFLCLVGGILYGSWAGFVISTLGDLSLLFLTLIFVSMMAQSLLKIKKAAKEFTDQPDPIIINFYLAGSLILSLGNLLAFSSEVMMTYSLVMQTDMFLPYVVTRFVYTLCNLCFVVIIMYVFYTFVV